MTPARYLGRATALSLAVFTSLTTMLVGQTSGAPIHASTMTATAAPSATVAPGYKLTTVATKLKVPRGLLATSDREFFVVEFGGWGKNAGSLSKVTLDPSGAATVKKIFTKLDRPLGIVLGPDKKAYVGEVGKIRRFDPFSPAPKLESVITDLPGKGLHPLTQLIFLNDKSLLVNVGSDTNNCEKSKNKTTCPAAESKTGLARLRQYTFNWSTGKPTGWTTYATGLRNSMGLAQHASGTILQVENSRDAINDADPKLNDEMLPHDELNVIFRGQSYGWPYCYDAKVNAPEFKKYDCAKTVAPVALLPAHSAPLGMTYWNNEIIISYHGYRDTGHRLVAFPVDALGVPNGAVKELIGDWVETDTQEMGGPVGVTVTPDNSLLIADDRNNVILRLTKA